MVELFSSMGVDFCLWSALLNVYATVEDSLMPAKADGEGTVWPQTSW
jgi:hypothetical protein